MKLGDLIAYCGTYCGSCARCQGSVFFREAIRLVAELVDSHGFQHWMPGAVKEFDYTEFRKALDFFGREDTWLVCQSCRAGSSGPPFCVRECCKEHKVDLCFECEEFPCDKVVDSPLHATTMERSEEYKKLGRQRWLQQAVKETGQGFESQTRKYYQIWAKECPPASSSNKDE